MTEVGRPSEYTDDACAVVIRMGAEGKSVVQMACELNVHRDTLYEWAKVHPAFSDAFTRARLLAQAWWEETGQTNLATQGFNASLYAKIIGSRFKADYGDRQAIEHSGPDGGALKHDVTVTMTPDEAYRRMLDGG